MEIWIVGFGTGAYEDRRTIPVAAYTDKAVAEAVRARFESELAAAGLDKAETARKVDYDDLYWRGYSVDPLSGAYIYIIGPRPLNVPIPDLPKKFGNNDDHLR